MGKIGRGRPLRSQTREVIYNVKKYFDKEKEIECSLRPYKQVSQRVSEATGVSLNGVQKVCRQAEGAAAAGRPFPSDTPGKTRPRSAKISKPDNFALAAIRQRIHRFYEHGEIPTLKRLLDALKKEQDEDSPTFIGGREFLRVLLIRHLGFRFVKVDCRRHLLERTDVVSRRHQFLHEVRNEDFNNIVFLDETWVNENHCKSKCWQSEECSGLQAPTGKGKRLIVLHAGSSKGFVKDGLLLFRSKSGKADYHDDMNAECFTEWFVKQLLPNIPSKSVIVMDNAPYHSVQVEKAPTLRSRKGEMQEWLNKNGIVHGSNMLKAELYEIVKANKPGKKRYVIDELAAAPPFHHKVIRLPPYHCQFNPIERIWAHVKREVAEKNNTYKMSDVEHLTKEAIRGISAETWAKAVEHVKRDVDEYWVKDGLIETQIEPFIISANNLEDESDPSEYYASTDENSDLENSFSVLDY